MIASGTQPADGNRATLDDLFRRAGVRRADAPALADLSRSLTYAQADRAISALAARLRSFGLATDAVVAVQLPNSVENVIVLLGILRAGMIAAPLPLLWRQQEMVAALSRAGAKGIVTSSAQAGVAMQAAVEVFPIRAIAGFGRDLPDGVVPLDDVFGPGAEFFQSFARPGNSAAHVAAITFDVTGDGIVPIARSHSGLIAGGREVFLEGGIGQDETILSTIPPSSFAGIALAVVPWLLGGGTLALHHGFDPVAFAKQCRAYDAATIALPGPALAALADAGLLGNAVKNILALWRAPEQLAAAAPWRGSAGLVDIASFGEIGLRPARREPDGMPTPILSRAVTTPRGAALTAVGFYRFRQHDVEVAVAAVDPAAVIATLPDVYLGQRLAGSAQDGAALATKLQARGVNALIAGAFRPRGNANAA